MMSRADSDDPLYEVAVAVEVDHELTAEMAEWEVATIEDGISSGGIRLSLPPVTRNVRPGSRPLRARGGLH